MADDVVQIRLAVDESTVTQSRNRVQNLINQLSNQTIRLRIEAINFNSINSQLEQLQSRIRQLNGSSININSNAMLTAEQQQYRLETQRLAVLQRIELARENFAD